MKGGQGGRERDEERGIVRRVIYAPSLNVEDRKMARR